MTCRILLKNGGLNEFYLKLVIEIIEKKACAAGMCRYNTLMKSFVTENCFYFGIRLEVMKWSSLWIPQMMIWFVSSVEPFYAALYDSNATMSSARNAFCSGWKGNNFQYFIIRQTRLDEAGKCCKRISRTTK